MVSGLIFICISFYVYFRPKAAYNNPLLNIEILWCDKLSRYPEPKPFLIIRYKIVQVWGHIRYLLTNKMELKMHKIKINKIATYAGAIALTAASIAAGLAPTQAAAQSYDGFCYQKESSNTKTKGTVIGAAGGAALGNIVAKKGDKTKGTILGAAVGGIVGNQVGENIKDKNKDKATCLNDRYYVYSKGFYTPSPAPKGYKVTYFYDRPAGMKYIHPR